ncbi:MAG: dihydroorotase family protein [Acidobacteria bacterium]|nr:dihydroorotase family protein [Acidobacteriota bacterium]
MIIRNGRVAFPERDEPQRADLRVEEGIIAEIGKGLGGDSDVLDAGGLLVLPGGIDPHVHFDDPGYTHREDFTHGSMAAAAGGVTTVVDMPCTSVPPVTTLANLETKLAAIAGKSVVDFGLYGGISRQSFDEGFPGNVRELAPEVLGIKAYFVSGMDTFARLDHWRFERLLTETASLGLPVLLHAEDFDYVSAAEPWARRRGNEPVRHYEARPESAELLAAVCAVTLSRRTGAPLHLCHVGTAAAAEFTRGIRTVTCETAPHYLAFDLEDFARIGAPLKITPPVKPGQRDALWRLLALNTVTFAASDHAPCPREEKETGSIWTDYSGIPGTGTLLPYLLSEGYLAGRLSLSRFTDVIAGSAARRYGLADRKGHLVVGKDADFALVDPEGNWTVEGARFLSKGKITPFEGMTLRGKVVKTLVRGRVVYDATEGIVAEPGWGRRLRRHA